MSGRVVVVTGSTSGIGAGIARRFALDGESVVVHGRSQERGAAILAELRDEAPRADVRLCLGDLTDPAAPERLIAFAAKATGQVDVLVNNAGTNVFTGVLASTLEDWEHAIALDLRAAWLCARAAATRMPRGSAIVNIGSNHAWSTLPGSFPYNVAKAGLVALTQSLAIELAPLGIRANLVAPGYIDTPLAEDWFGSFADPEAERARVRRLHPAGRIGTPDDVARAVRYLASADESGFVTGTTLLLDGGRATGLEDPRD
jgi:NAD(P)-dependent dehydrogenase (short-subunit alcohol dehydrogenase family)